MNEEKEKQKLDKVGNSRIEIIEKDLENELNAFKQKYNENELRIIFDNKSDDLLNKDSDLTKEYINYKESVDKILIYSKSFNKHIEDIDQIMKKLLTPDIVNYETWNVNEIRNWIQSLENDPFSKHIDLLRNGFIESEIRGSDLPEITSGDSSSSPFNIKQFRDKKDLEKHFKSLKNQIPQTAEEDNEGGILATAYI